MSSSDEKNRAGIDKENKAAKPSRKTRTVDEAAAELGISKNAAYQAIEKGQIPHIRFGRRILIPTVALQRLLETGG